LIKNIKERISLNNLNNQNKKLIKKNISENDDKMNNLNISNINPINNNLSYENKLFSSCQSTMNSFENELNSNNLIISNNSSLNINSSLKKESKTDFKLSDSRINQFLDNRRNNILNRRFKNNEVKIVDDSIINSNENENENDFIFKIISEWKDYPEDNYDFISLNFFFFNHSLSKNINENTLNQIINKIINKIELNKSIFLTNFGYNISLVLLLNYIFTKFKNQHINGSVKNFNTLKSFYVSFLENFQSIDRSELKINIINNFIYNFLKVINLKDFIEILLNQKIDFIFEKFFSLFFYNRIKIISPNDIVNNINNEELTALLKRFINIFSFNENINNFNCINTLYSNLFLKLFTRDLKDKLNDIQKQIFNKIIDKNIKELEKDYINILEDINKYEIKDMIKDYSS